MGAALNGQLERTEQLLDQGMKLLGEWNSTNPTATVPADVVAAAEAARARLATVLSEAKDFVAGELARARTGRKLLQRYSEHTTELGSIVESRA
jgi:hypothetical protein